MFKFVDNEKLKEEVKKALSENGYLAKEIAEKMGVKPQQYNNILNKENLAFRDVKRICDAMDCDLMIEIVKREEEK